MGSGSLSNCGIGVRDRTVHLLRKRFGNVLIPFILYTIAEYTPDLTHGSSAASCTLCAHTLTVCLTVTFFRILTSSRRTSQSHFPDPPNVTSIAASTAHSRNPASYASLFAGEVESALSHSPEPPKAASRAASAAHSGS